MIFGIPRGSKSYPYLALSREIGATYSAVLLYADALIMGHRGDHMKMTDHHRYACDALSGEQKVRVNKLVQEVEYPS